MLTPSDNTCTGVGRNPPLESLLIVFGFDGGLEQHLAGVLFGADDVLEGHAGILVELQGGGALDFLHQCLAQALGVVGYDGGVVHAAGERAMVGEGARGGVEGEAVGACEVVDGCGAVLARVLAGFLTGALFDALLACRQGKC